MLERIEITQRFNFKKMNKHYECFIIDLVSKTAYFKINERIYNEQYIEESCLCDNTWAPILADLKNRVTTEIRRMDEKSVDIFRSEFSGLNLFDDFASEDFSYFEKLESIYSCNVNLYYTDSYREYCIKNDFPLNWLEFSRLLNKMFDFDVLNIGHLRNVVTRLFFEISRNGVYDKTGDKLELTSLEFGHYECYPYDTPHPSIVIDFNEGIIDGYFESVDADLSVLSGLLEKYGVYEWIFKDWQNKSLNHDSAVLDGYDWYLELVFDNSIIWNILGHNEYPDTYLCLAGEIRNLTDLDLLEIETIPDEDIELLNHYGKMKLSQK